MTHAERTGDLPELDRRRVSDELRQAPAAYRQLLDAVTPAALNRRTDGTRWTNREMLFHLLLGYAVTRTLLPLVRAVSRLPPPLGRGFAAVLNAGRAPFNVVNYFGSMIGGHLLTLHRMGTLHVRICHALVRRLEREKDADLKLAMPFPTAWDPFFTDHMTLLQVYHYPLQHFEFHRRQLTVDPPY